jgi:molybdate transport system ATP-binding protein
MTLKCIAGIETPDEGFISINGRVLFDSTKRINVKPQRRRVGYLFQNYALFPRMTVLENLSIGLKQPDRLAGAWLEKFQLTEFAHRYPSQLSGGQQQRAALARMLMREPEAILLDEPFSALDTGLRELMQIHMLELLANRRDAVLVTHSRDEVFRLCGELLVMDGGRALTMGKTRDLFARPGLTPVARLTGCKNISPVTITGEREIYAVNWGVTLGTGVPVPAGTTHVGIRAHDLAPVFPAAVGNPAVGNPTGGNLIRMKVTSCSEEPFEEAVLFTNADAVPADGNADNRSADGRYADGIPADNTLWWKYSKYLNLPALPPYLYAPPERLLLLRDST